MKKLFLTTIIPFICFALQAQDFSLDEAWRLAKTNYPAIKKYDLIKKSGEYTLQNAGKMYLPQISIGGQATYQSDVTKIPVNMPGIKELSKDQYRLQAEISQLIYDGGAVNAQKEIIKATEAAQLQSIEVTMQAVKERITDVYFGILLLDEQLAQIVLRKQTLEAALKKAENAYANGTGFKSNVNELKAEILSADMSIIELKADQRGYKDMLGELTGKTITEQTTFNRPQNTELTESISRPELKLFDLQKNVYNAQARKLKSDWMPKISAFAQGGYGRPGLNMLNNNFTTFALGGIRFSFPINSIYTWKNNLKIAELNKQQLEVDKETFLLNTNTQLQKQKREMDKYKSLLKEDDNVIELRKTVTASAQAQLDNHVITISEYIQKLNAEYLARQTKSLHELLFIKSNYNYSTISGN